VENCHSNFVDGRRQKHTNKYVGKQTFPVSPYIIHAYIALHALLSSCDFESQTNVTLCCIRAPIM
jgi:hypothetical protein